MIEGEMDNVYPIVTPIRRNALVRTPAPAATSPLYERTSPLSPFLCAMLEEAA